MIDALGKNPPKRKSGTAVSARTEIPFGFQTGHRSEIALGDFKDFPCSVFRWIPRQAVSAVVAAKRPGSGGSFSKGRQSVLNICGFNALSVGNISQGNIAAFAFLLLRQIDHHGEGHSGLWWIFSWPFSFREIFLSHIKPIGILCKEVSPDF